MKKIGLFYSFNSVKTRQQAEKMCKALGEDNVEKVNVEDATQQKFMEFSNYILAVPTWLMENCLTTGMSFCHQWRTIL